MAYKRSTTATQLLAADALTGAMAGIGMNLAAKPVADANIEDTLLAASIEGLVHDDLRVLAILVTWLSVHSPRINVDRLTRAVATQSSARVRAFWSAAARWLEKDRRFARLAKIYRGPRVELLTVGTSFQIRRAGEDPRFEGGPLRVPANVLRDRPADVLSPAELARRHRAYRLRVMIGPSYRADMWAALEAKPSMSATELARITYGSFATAWHVKHDRGLLAKVRPGAR